MLKPAVVVTNPLTRAGQVALIATALLSTMWWQLRLFPAQLAGEEPGVIAVPVAAIGLVVAAVLGSVYVLRSRWQPSPPYGLLAAGGLTLVAAVAGVPQATNPALAALGALQVVLLLAVFCSLGAGLLPPAWLAGAFIAGLAVQVPLIVAQTANQVTWTSALLLSWASDYTPDSTGASVLLRADGTRWLRPLGVFFHPNILGGYLAVALVLLVAAWLGQVDWRRGWWRTFVGGAVLGLFAACLLLSASRAAWLGAAFGGSIVAVGSARMGTSIGRNTFTSPRWIVTAAAALCVVVALLAWLQPPLLGRLAPTGDRLETQSVAARLFYDELGVQALALRPLTGVGMGNSIPAETVLFNNAYVPEQVPNVPLLMAVELGPLGVVAWLSAATTIAVETYRRPAVWTVAFAAALTTSAVTGMFDHYFWSFAPGRITIVLLAGGWAAAWRDAGEKQQDAPA